MPDFVVFGAGCYGRLHVRHLLQARARGAIQFGRIVVVDRNPIHKRKSMPTVSSDIVHIEALWEDFIAQAVKPESLPESTELVLPCVGPHLLEIWLAARFAESGLYDVTFIPWKGTLGLPFEVTLPVGTHAVSYATWRCPSTCIEPAVCPATRKTRDWDMAATLTEGAKSWKNNGINVNSTILFISRHRAWGVASLPTSDLYSSWSRLEAELKEHDELKVLVATISSCHGLLGILDVRASSGDSSQ